MIETNSQDADDADDADDIVTKTLDFVRIVQQDGHTDRFDDFIHPDFVDHTAPAGTPGNRKSGRAMMQGLHAALTDISIDVIHCFADGDDVVATQKIVRGRQIGDWMGRSPTGQRVGLRIMDFMRFDDGRVVEHWSVHSLADEGEAAPPASS